MKRVYPPPLPGLRIGRGLCLLAAVLIAAGCSGNSGDRARSAFEQGGSTAELPASHPPITDSGVTPGKAVSSVAGIGWTSPDTWLPGGERPMRAATYTVPAAEGGGAAGECAVYYFGAGQGGGVEANIERWIGQFEQPGGGSSDDVARTEKREAGGMPVTLLEVHGTYTGSMGPGAPGGSHDENYRMLAAIVEGPEGAVFFKFTGPDAVVQAARKDFDGLVASIHRTP